MANEQALNFPNSDADKADKPDNADNADKDKDQEDDPYGDVDYGDVDYGDDDDDEDLDDLNDGIGNLDFSDNDDLPPESALPTKQQFKSEVCSTLANPHEIPISFKLELDATETPNDYSDDDDSAPNLKINQYQLIGSSDQKDGNDDGDTLLGSGSFAKVYRAKDLSEKGKKVALKCMYKNLLRKQFLMKSRYDLKSDSDIPMMIRHTMLDAVQDEIQIMLKTKNEYIVELFGIIDDPTRDELYLAIEYSAFGQIMDWNGKILQYEPSKKLVPTHKYIVTDMNVDQPWWYHKYVFKQSENEKPPKKREKVERLNEKTAKRLFLNCVNAITYLHLNNVIHRDLKPENILLYKDDKSDIGLIAKIADFGTAEEFESKDDAILIDTQGTYHFMSPSAIGGEKRNAFCDDVWSLGCCLFIFIFGTVPFHHPIDYQLFESIQKDELQIPNNNNLRASKEVRNLIEYLLLKDDNKRLDLQSISKHLWFKDIQSKK